MHEGTLLPEAVDEPSIPTRSKRIRDVSIIAEEPTPRREFEIPLLVRIFILQCVHGFTHFRVEIQSLYMMESYWD